MISTIKKSKLYQYIKKIIFGIITFYKYTKNKLNSKYKKCARVLTYHRIDNINFDPTKLSVSVREFENQIVFLRDNFKILKLSDLCKKIEEHSITGDEISITFDDGYRDNLINALPILQKYNIPATVFITTSQLGQISNHPWDSLYRANEKAKFLSEEEIIQLTNSNIEIGGHTENHKSLKKLSFQDQNTEIKVNKDKLEKIICDSITHFAYPYGEFNHIDTDSVKVVKNFYKYAFLNNNELITKDVDIYKIPRINIQNQSIDLFKKTIFYD